MILAFKKEFVPKILEGSKIHTIREDKPNRWKVGNKIHFATGVRTKNYNQFKEGECISVQDFEVKYTKFKDHTYVSIYVDERVIASASLVNCVVGGTSGFMKVLARDDGFKDVNEFLEWFSDDFKGKLIHWTDKKY